MGKMIIVQDEQLGDFRLLSVNGDIPSIYSYVIINGEQFDIVPSHNMDNYVAIESNKSHLGEEIEFVLDVMVKDGN